MFLIWLLPNELVLAIGIDDVIINIWRPTYPGRIGYYDGHASLQTREHYMSFRPQEKEETSEAFTSILVTNIGADIAKEGDRLPHVRYTLNKKTLGLDIDPKRINKKFEDFLEFNNLELSSLKQKEQLNTQNTKWTDKVLLEFESGKPFYTGSQSSTTFVMNLLDSGFEREPLRLPLAPQFFAISVENLEARLENDVGEKGKHQDCYQDIYRARSVGQTKRLKELENENLSLKEQVAALISQIENL